MDDDTHERLAYDATLLGTDTVEMFGVEHAITTARALILTGIGVIENALGEGRGVAMVREIADYFPGVPPNA